MRRAAAKLQPEMILLDIGLPRTRRIATSGALWTAAALLLETYCLVSPRATAMEVTRADANESTPTMQDRVAQQSSAYYPHTSLR